MLKSWSIENFKSIIKSGELKLAPVTVLAGLNSSGKTSLLQSILMIAQTLSHQIADRPLVTNGTIVQLGTFEDILSDFSESRTMGCMFKLHVTHDPLDDPFNEDPYASKEEWKYQIKVQFLSVNESGADLSAIDASKILVDKVSLKSYFEYSSNDGPLQEKWETHKVKETFLFKESTNDEFKQFLDDVELASRRLALYDGYTHLGICKSIDEATRNFDVSASMDSLSVDRNDQFQALASLFHFLPASILRKEDSYVHSGKILSSMAYPYQDDINTAREQITTFFTTQIRYLGPLRSDPGTTQRRFSSGELDDVGPEGEYAAMVYQANRFAQVGYYNPFTRENEQATLQIALDKWLQYLGVANQVRIEAGGMKDVFWKVLLKPDQNPRTLLEVGFGVSQILPILVMGLLAPKNTLLIIEQPELHLHPRLQARLGDFFVGLSKCDKQCLIETHSENLVNQLRYHIVEAEGQEKSDCMIYFVDQDKQGAARFEPVEISPQGNILNWPEGFFDETILQEGRIATEGMRKKAKQASNG